MKEQRGITIITLIITIILMLILATVSVNVAINGGLFEKARDAVDSTEIANEKDTVVKANIIAKSKNKTVTVDDMQKALNSIADENAATAMDNGDTIVVKFNKNDRYYEIENNGKVEGPIELVKDEHAGDITKGGAYDGSADTPYEIWCIEDLVMFSKLINNKEINNKCYVKLMRNLNFKSIFSYNDYHGKYSYDETTNSYIKNINSTKTLKDLCTSDFGFIPIGTDTVAFSGNFNGQGFEIENIYVNKLNNAGLFGVATNCIIQNLGISGNIVSEGIYVGGIVGKGMFSSFYKCYNRANITGVSYVGGIVGHGSWGAAVMEECSNYGYIYITGSRAGGVAGSYAGKIINCNNEGNIDGERVGGILGSSSGVVEITNCYNKGNLKSRENQADGILGELYSDVIVNNCFNVGIISSSYASGINATEANNCYNLGTLKGLKKLRTIYATTINNCYYSSKVATEGEIVEIGVVDIAEKTVEEFVQLLNSYRDEKNIYPTSWKKWTVGEDGYPVFE